jgi:hypothetical protein
LVTIKAQVEQHLDKLVVPDDYQQIVLQALLHERPRVAADDAKRRELEARLSRVGDRYELGDISRAEYEAKRAALRSELERLNGRDNFAQPEVLAKLREYLGQVPAAWRDASPELRNKLARTLFEEILVEGGLVLGAVPRPEYLPFFALDESLRGFENANTPAETCGGVNGVLNGRARGDSNPNARAGHGIVRPLRNPVSHPFRDRS